MLRCNTFYSIHILNAIIFNDFNCRLYLWPCCFDSVSFPNARSSFLFHILDACF